MKPGEFVGADGRMFEVELVRGHTVPRGLTATFYPFNPDFPAAVAALQSLVRPSLDPRSGRVLAMREGGPFEWEGRGTNPTYRYRWRAGRVEYLSSYGDGWVHFGHDIDAVFEAGRRYERERG